MTDRGRAISARNVERIHGGRLVVAGIDLDVPSATCFGIVGRNGAGKTTLMRMLSCTLIPHAGTLEVLGRDARRDPRAIKSKIGVVPQGMTLDPELRVRENLTAFGRYHGLGREETAHRTVELLDDVGLSDYADAGVEELSGGMQRRLLIARAMINKPDLLLLDEPTTGLDPESRVLVWDQLTRLRRTGTTLVVTTHYLDEVERLCDLVAVMQAGEIRRRATPDALLKDTMTDRVVEFGAAGLSAESVSAICLGIPHEVHRVGERFLVLTDEPESAAHMIRAQAADRDTRVRQSRLEDCLLILDEENKGGSRAPRLAPKETGPVGAGLRSMPALREFGPPKLAAARHVWARNAAMFRRAYRTTFVPNFFEPVLYLVAFGAGLGQYIQQGRLGGGYTEYVAPGLLAISAMNGAVFEVTYNIFVRLKHSRIYDAVVTTPLEPRDIALGELLWSLTRCTVYGTVFLTLIWAAGLTGAPAAPLAILAFPVMGLPFSALGMLFTSKVHAINAYSYFYTLGLTPLTLCSGAFFPTDNLPGPLLVLNWFNPLRHCVELMRALVHSGDPAMVAEHGGWLVVAGLLVLMPALRSLDRKLVT